MKHQQDINITFQWEKECHCHVPVFESNEYKDMLFSFFNWGLAELLTVPGVREARNSRWSPDVCAGYETYRQFHTVCVHTSSCFIVSMSLCACMLAHMRVDSVAPHWYLDINTWHRYRQSQHARQRIICRLWCVLGMILAVSACWHEILKVKDNRWRRCLCLLWSKLFKLYSLEICWNVDQSGRRNHLIKEITLGFACLFFLCVFWFSP